MLLSIGLDAPDGSALDEAAMVDRVRRTILQSPTYGGVGACGLLSHGTVSSCDQICWGAVLTLVLPYQGLATGGAGDAGVWSQGTRRQLMPMTPQDRSASFWKAYTDRS